MSVHNLRNNLDDQDDIDAIVAFVLNNLGDAPPPPSFFKTLADKPPPAPTVDSLQTRLSNEKELHRKELEKIYDFQAAEREKLHKMHRAGMDEGDFWPDYTMGDRPKGSTERRQMPLHWPNWAAASSIHQQTHTFDATLTEFNNAHLRLQEPLYAELEALKKTARQQDEEKRNALPSSLMEFDAMTSKNYQISVARFLDTDRMQQLPQEMQRQLGPGVTEAIHALKAAYLSDTTFQTRVKDLLASIQTSDPRRRTQP